MDENENQDVRFVVTKPKSRRRRPIRLLIVLALVLGAAGYCGWRYRQIVSSPIDVANATNAEAISWLALRDLSSESKETRGELFDLYFDKLAGNEGGEFVFDENDAIEIPSNLQSVASSFLRSSDQKVDAWDKKRVRPPFARIDYVIRPADGVSAYVVSADIQPGPGLEKRWQERHVAVAKREVRKANVERNIQMLLMEWFESRRKRYDATPDDQKKEYLLKCAAEIASLQAFYNNLRVSGGQPALNRVQQLREFERMNEGWCEFAELDELARVMWFKDLIVTVTALSESGVDESPLYPPRRPGAKAEPADDASAPSPKDAAKLVLDAVRSYFFVKK